MVTTQTLQMSEQEYRAFALGDDSSQWELVHGQLREKPGMSIEHDFVTSNLVEVLVLQLDHNHFRLSIGQARLRVSAETYYIPDVAVSPTAVVMALRETPRALNAYPDPLPLVIEIWSPSTGIYDVTKKIPGYQQRGDREIWRIHPYERTLTVWRRLSDGLYDTSVHRDGSVRAEPVPGVVIDLAVLFGQGPR